MRACSVTSVDVENVTVSLGRIVRSGTVQMGQIGSCHQLRTSRRAREMTFSSPALGRCGYLRAVNPEPDLSRRSDSGDNASIPIGVQSLRRRNPRKRKRPQRR